MDGSDGSDKGGLRNYYSRQRLHKDEHQEEVLRHREEAGPRLFGYNYLWETDEQNPQEDDDPLTYQDFQEGPPPTPGRSMNLEEGIPLEDEPPSVPHQDFQDGPSPTPTRSRNLEGDIPLEKDSSSIASEFPRPRHEPPSVPSRFPSTRASSSSVVRHKDDPPPITLGGYPSTRASSSSVTRPQDDPPPFPSGFLSTRASSSSVTRPQDDPPPIPSGFPSTWASSSSVPRPRDDPPPTPRLWLEEEEAKRMSCQWQTLSERADPWRYNPQQHQQPGGDQRRLDQLQQVQSPEQTQAQRLQRAEAEQHKRKARADDQQQQQQPDSKRPQSSGLSTTPAAVVVDEIGEIPAVCRVVVDPRNIPPRVSRLRAAIMYHFKLTRSVFGMRDSRYPVNEIFMEWGRRWIIKRSTIKQDDIETPHTSRSYEHAQAKTILKNATKGWDWMYAAGLGLFASEDINLPNNGSGDFYVKYIPLFPYVGATFKLNQFDQIAPWYPIMRRYALQVVRGSYDDGNQLVVVGNAREDHNLAAFINSNLGSEHETGPANCEWQYVDNTLSACHYHDKKCQNYLDTIQQQSKITHYDMTVATRNIAKGQELFVDYDFKIE